ncbi:MAG: VWA domain-containing protein, partial [Woeseiaceae bacterium]
MFAALALIVLILLISYWIYFRVWADNTRQLHFPLLVIAMLVLLAFVGRSGESARNLGTPVLLAIAADVSLSMGTVPEPSRNEGVGTRLERAQQVLLPVLAHLSTVVRPVLVSVTAFTSKSETIMAWDDDLSLVREIIDIVLTTGLLTEAGSDLGVALNGVIAHFESLPDGYQSSAHPKFLIVVSDGERTISRANSDTALAR